MKTETDTHMTKFTVFGEGVNQPLIIHSQLYMFPDEGSPVITLAPMTCPVQAMLQLQDGLPFLCHPQYLPA